MRILVTGGAGFIGSRIASAYLEAGHEVAVMDDLSAGTREAVPAGARFIDADIRSSEARAALIQFRPEVVNHHAAQKSIPRSVAEPSADASVNIMGLLNLVEAGSAAGMKRFVFASSGGALCGDAPVSPAPEDTPPTTASPYAVAKLASERYLLCLGALGGFEPVILRYANVYGPGQHAQGECGVVPIFLSDIARGQVSTLYAYPDQADGTVRDYVHVDDVVRANLLALEKGGGQVLNIGSGEGIAIRALYRMSAAAAGTGATGTAMGTGLPLREAGPRAGDVRVSVLDRRKAARVLGWEPRIGLEAGLRGLFAPA